MIPGFLPGRASLPLQLCCNRPSPKSVRGVLVEADPKAIAELRGVSKIYGSGDLAVKALDQLDLVIREGDYLAVMGASGSGKSTAMNILGCLDRPTQGSYRLNDMAIDQLDDDALAYEDRYDFIDAMRKKTKAVVDRFLKDLGFDEDLMLVDFSGNKGFHLTFDDEKYRNLDQSDRRQIIDYIIGNKLDRDILLVNNKLSHYGWNKQAVFFLENLLKDPSKENIEKYFTKNKVKKINSLLTDPAVIARLSAGSLVDFDTKVLKLAMMKEHRLNIKNVVDKKPTVDKHRIFRVPGSLHPKSGLPSVRLSKHHLDSTDAIIDEIMIAAGEDMVTITIGEDVEIDFPRETVFTEGTHTVPRYEALCILTEACKKHWN